MARWARPRYPSRSCRFRHLSADRRQRFNTQAELLEWSPGSCGWMFRFLQALQLAPQCPWCCKWGMLPAPMALRLPCSNHPPRRNHCQNRQNESRKREGAGLGDRTLAESIRDIVQIGDAERSRRREREHILNRQLLNSLLERHSRQGNGQCERSVGGRATGGAIVEANRVGGGAAVAAVPFVLDKPEIWRCGGTVEAGCSQAEVFDDLYRSTLKNRDRPSLGKRKTRDGPEFSGIRRDESRVDRYFITDCGVRRVGCCQAAQGGPGSREVRGDASGFGSAGKRSDDQARVGPVVVSQRDVREDLV